MQNTQIQQTSAYTRLEREKSSGLEVESLFINEERFARVRGLFSAKPTEKLKNS